MKTKNLSELDSDLVNHHIMKNPIKTEFNISQTQSNLITENFTYCILDVAYMAIGKTNNINKIILVLWWNHDCNSIKNV